MKYTAFLRGTVAGMAGGLSGMYLMYWSGAGIFALMGWPANTSYTIIGDSAAAFFSTLGINLAGGAALGIRTYYLIGLVLGAAFGIALDRLEPLRRATFLKKVGLSVLYVEAMSLPLLAAGTLALKMSAADALLWSGISFAMHLVYGLVLGVVAGYGAGGARLQGAAYG